MVTTHRIVWRLLGIVALAACIVQIGLFLNHLSTPDITRGTMFEAASRVLRGLPLYPPASAEYVAMTYNPFFPVLTAAVSLVTGLNSATLRLVAIMGTLGAWSIIFLAVRRETKSALLGLLAVGLFAGAYLTLDAYMDYGNADSWMLFASLLGLYLIHLNRGRGWDWLGVAILCIGFWFKQHGALMTGAGVLYLTWRDGLWRAVPAWILAGILGPGSFLVFGPRLFGSEFIYFTLRVAGAWSALGGDTIGRFIEHILRHWLVLGAASGWAVLKALKARLKGVNIWVFCLPFAGLIAFLGVLDAGSENNNFLVMDTFFIIVGTITLAKIAQKGSNRFIRSERLVNGLVIAGIALAFIANLYDVRRAIVPPESWQQYDDLVKMVNSLDAIVYMPFVAQLPGGARLPYVAHWVQLEDMVRGPGRETRANPVIMSILKPLSYPPGHNAYILTDYPLGQDPLLGFLAPDYGFVADLGDRFKLLRALPGRISGTSWPRYLYAHQDNHPR